MKGLPADAPLAQELDRIAKKLEKDISHYPNSAVDQIAFLRKDLSYILRAKKIIEKLEGSLGD